MGTSRCLAADQSGCAVSEQDPAAPEIASREAVASPQGKGDPQACEMGWAFPGKLWKAAGTAVPPSWHKHRPLLGEEMQSKLLRMFFKNANELFFNSFIFMTVLLWGC